MHPHFGCQCSQLTMTPQKKWPVSKSCLIGIVAAQSLFSQSWNRWNYPKQPLEEDILQLSAPAIPFDDLEQEDKPHDDDDQTNIRPGCGRTMVEKDSMLSPRPLITLSTRCDHMIILITPSTRCDNHVFYIISTIQSSNRPRPAIWAPNDIGEWPRNKIVTNIGRGMTF